MTSSEVLPLVKLLAKVAVAQYIQDIKSSNSNKQQESNPNKTKEKYSE